MDAEPKTSAIEKHVIKFVTDLRIERNLKQEDIAAIINVSREFITKIENPNHRAKYNLNHIDKLADHFGMSPKDFLPDTATSYIKK